MSDLLRIAKRPAASTHSGATVQAAFDAMLAARVGAVVVLNEGRLVEQFGQTNQTLVDYFAADGGGGLTCQRAKPERLKRKLVAHFETFLEASRKRGAPVMRFGAPCHTNREF